MPECCFVSACSSFSLHSLLCISPFSLPFLFLTLESYSLVPFLLACFVLSRCATRGQMDTGFLPILCAEQGRCWAQGVHPFRLGPVPERFLTPVHFTHHEAMDIGDV